MAETEDRSSGDPGVSALTVRGGRADSRVANVLMDRLRPHHARALGGFAVVLAAGVAIAVVAIADAGGGDDVDDTVTVTTPVQLLPLAKRTAEVVERPPGVSVRVRTPGADASLTALCTGQVDVALAERRLTRDERETCTRIGHQAVAVYTSGRLHVSCLTLAELRGLFLPGSRVERYNQLDASLPALPVRLPVPVPGRSAFQLLTRTALGAEGRLRRDARAIRDTADFEHILSDAPAALGVYGIGLLGFDGLALDAVAVDAGDGCVAPRAEPLYAYTTRSALEREPVARFFETLIERAPEFADYAGVVPPVDPAARAVSR